MRLPSHRSVTVQLMALVAVGLAGLLGFAVLSAVQVRSTMLDERKATLRAVVQEATTVAAAYQELADAGEMTEDEAKAQTLVALGAQRYDPSGYLFGYTTDGTCFLLDPKPERVGKNFIDEKDKAGNLYIAQIVQAATGGGGYTEYWFPKPDADTPSPKLAYSAVFEPWGWVLGTGLYIDDVQAAFVAQLQVNLLHQVLPVLLVMLGAGLFVSRRITRQIRRVGAALDRADLTTRLDEGDGRTELDQLARSLNQLLDGVARTVRDVVGIGRGLEAGAAELSQASRDLAGIAENTARHAQEGSTASQSLSESIGSLAAGSEEMGATIREISGNAAEAARVAGQAVDAAQAATGTIGELGSSSQEIGSVVKVINNIAGQTKLLALNATIESARAGEAGKGFAVVATEVKDLAQGTTTASEDIVRRVDALVGDMGRAADAISQVSEIIGHINSFQVTIAGAIEEQTATTQEINHVVAAAADSGRVVSDLLQQVADEASGTLRGLEPVRRHAEQLVAASAGLREATSGFHVGE